MSLAAIDSKQFIKDYLQALSGQPKTEELINQYVSDPGLKEHIVQVEAAFPSYEVVTHQLIAEGDLVAARLTFQGIHQGEFAGIPPTGRHVSTDFMIIYLVQDTRVAGYWIQIDQQDLVRQLTA